MMNTFQNESTTRIVPYTIISSHQYDFSGVLLSHNPRPSSLLPFITCHATNSTCMKTDPGRMNNKCVRAAPCTPNNSSVCCRCVHRSWRSSLFLGLNTRVVYPKSNKRSTNSSSFVMRRVLSCRRIRVMRGRHGGEMSGTMCPFQAFPRRF